MNTLKEPLNYIKHIRDECDYLLEDSAGVSYESFLANERLKRAFVRSLEIIGEATESIENEYRLQYPEIEWKKMAGMRDRLIHAYFDTNYKIVWDIVRNKIPVLRQQVEEIILESEV